MEDLTGRKFGKWIVLEKAFENKKHGQFYKCKCDCGNIRNINGRNMLIGRSLSCGCMGRENAIKALTKHNGSKTKLYKIWSGMRRRCFDKNNPAYKNYGGRGITICEEWNDFAIFREWSLANGYKDNLSIDRINNGEGYNPNNCRWATRKEQANNTRKNKIIEINNETHTLSQWAEIKKLDLNVVWRRSIKGIKGDDLIKPRNYFRQKYFYNFISPEGLVFNEIRNIGEFCKIHKLCWDTIRTNFRCKKEYYNGWKINRILNKKDDKR